MKHQFKTFFKHFLKFSRSTKVRFGGLGFVLLAVLFIGYSFIPLPAIEDGYFPDEVRKVSFNAPLTLHFSDSMSRSSVEAHFSIQPPLAGHFRWVDSKTLEYIPDEPLVIDDDYVISIGSDAKSLYGKSIGLDYRLHFLVSGPPRIKFISPYFDPIEEKIEDQIDGQADEDGFVGGLSNTASDILIIPPNQAVTVMFDRPIRTLTTLDNIGFSEAFPELQIDPPVKGEYRWIGTTAFQFIPEKWTMGTTYTLKLPKGIPALDGGVTDEEWVWHLATEAPKIDNTTPFDGDDVVLTDQAITLHFNQSMDLDFVRPGDNVLLYPSNDKDADHNTREDGFFNTEVVYGKDPDGKVDRSYLVFKPEFPYQYDQEYKLVVKASLPGGAHQLQGGYGDRFMKEDFELKFKTISKPGIVSSLPQTGEKNYEDYFIQIEFASPVTSKMVEEHISISPAIEKKPRVSTMKQGRVVQIYYDLEPSTYYDFRFRGPFEDAVGNRGEGGVVISFKTAPVKPYLSLLSSNSFGMFTEGLDPVYPIKTVNVDELTMSLCHISESDFFSISKHYNWYTYRCPNPTRMTLELNSTLNKTHLRDLNLRQLFDTEFEPGIYFFEFSSDQYLDYNKKPRRFYQTFFITSTHLALKKSDQDLLVWATDLKTGEPVPRMELSIRSNGGEELQRGVTDGNGLYKITKPFENPVYVVGTKKLGGENRWSLVGLDWANGIESWRFGLRGEWVDHDQPRAYLYTDRPLYRPGDELFFKGFYRIDRDADLSFSKERKVRITLEDSEYNEVAVKDVSLLPDGSFNGGFNLSDKASLGRYNMYAQRISEDYTERFYHDFYVEEYKKPKFKVEVLASESDYRLGDSISADIQANYYFGGAINNGEVHWNVMREPYYFDAYRGKDYYSFAAWTGFDCHWGYCDSNQEVILSGDDQLNGEGRLHLSIPTDQDKESENPKDPQSYLYTLTAEVQNQDGEVVAKRESFIVHQGSYYVGLSPKQYLVQPGDPLRVRVISVDHSGEPVTGKKVTLELLREDWNTVKKQGVDGAFYDENVREFVSIKKQGLTIGSDPVDVNFNLDADVQGGRYVVRAIGDDGPNKIFSETSFYITSNLWTNWYSSNNNRMELVVDQPEYFVGGKARVMIQSPFGSTDELVKALITYERGNIQHYEIMDVTSNSQIVEVPIDETMVPNIYVTALVVKGAGVQFDRFLNQQNKDRLIAEKVAFESEINELKTAIEALNNEKDEKLKNRNVILVSKKEREMNLIEDKLLEVTNSLSELKNSDAESLDFNLIKPDFRYGIVSLKVNRREHEILVELKPSQPTYRAGEKVSIEIHTKDYQNRPLPAVISLAVVDESLLALKANQKINPLDYFFADRALQVKTSTNLSLHVDRVNVAAQKGAKGGGGAGNQEGFDKKRGEFKDTAYFNPLIETDDGGYAKVEFDPPDNLTSWEVWAVASSGQDRFGMAKEAFVVRKPISLSSILPRFVVSGDKLTVGALVHNQTDTDAETKVELIAKGLTIKGNAKKNVLIPAETSRRVDWDVTVDSVSRDAVLSVEFNSSEDVLVETLPVKTFAFPEVVSVNGTVDQVHTEKIRLPSSIVPNMGNLFLSTGGSLLTHFIQQFQGLKDYPYGCAEQITSQILPSIIVERQATVYQAADLYTLLNVDAKQNRLIIEDALQKVSKFQRFDGGYGYWEGADQSNDLLTAYIVYAQYLAGQADFLSDATQLSRSQQYLWKRLNDLNPQTRLRQDERAFALWVLSEVGQGDTGMTLSLFEKRDDLKLYSRALMLMTLQNLYNNGQKSVYSFIEKLKSEIVSEQIVEDRSIHFEENSQNWWDMNTNFRTTAMIMMALNRDNPDNPVLPNIVNYLTHTQKQKGGLMNTQETAWLLLSMLEYAESHNILNADFEFDVRVNRDKVLEGVINADNLTEVFNSEIPMATMKIGDDVNEITFQKDGKGEMIFDMELKYYLPNEVIPPFEKGFHITRQYFDFGGKETQIAKAFKSGEIYRGQLDIIVPEDMHQVVVEERLPAGFEAINFNLDNVDQNLEQQMQNEYSESSQNDDSVNPGSRYWYYNPLWHFNHKEMRDDRVLLFADYLPKGVYTYNFLIRAGLPGTYNHLPASAYQMYFPEVFGRTGGEFVVVKE